MPRVLATVLLLVCSNTFMTFAWYYHVQRKAWPLLVAIGISWLIALPEYILQVPANRLGHVSYGGLLTLPQLKVIQEAVTLLVFTAFVLLMTNEKMQKTDYLAMMLVLAGVAVSMWGRNAGMGGVLPAQAP